MKVKDLTQLSFGSPAAEREKQLSHYFIPSESFRRLRDGEKAVALGRRGAGKTAILKMIADHAKRNGRLVVQLSPEDYSYELLRRTILPESAGSWHKQSAYAAAWKYVLYILVMKVLIEQGPRMKFGARSRIAQYLRDNNIEVEANPIGALIAYLKRLEEVKIGPFKVGVKTSELQRLYSVDEIHQQLVDLRSMLARQSVLILVDELDRGWDASEEAQAFVAGLFRAAMAINQEVEGINVILSLRHELYEAIPSLYEDAQKIRDLIEVIAWDEDSLLELISKRIAVSLPETGHLDAKARWNSIFGKIFSSTRGDSFSYVVERSLYRPREVIQFCDTLRDIELKRRRGAEFFRDTVREAEYTHSESRHSDIAAEYRFHYKGLRHVFDTFRGCPAVWSREDLAFHCLKIVEKELEVHEAWEWCGCLDSYDMIKTLWDIGFLRAKAAGGKHISSGLRDTYLGPHQISGLNISNVSSFDIHPMFRSYLGIEMNGSET